MEIDCKGDFVGKENKDKRVYENNTEFVIDIKDENWDKNTKYRAYIGGGVVWE